MIVKRLFLYTVAAVTFCFLPTKCNGFFFRFFNIIHHHHRCSSDTTETYQRCGLFNFKTLVRNGIPGTDNCHEYCVFFLSSSFDCGGCNYIEVINPTRTPVTTSPSLIPPIVTSPTFTPVVASPTITPVVASPTTVLIPSPTQIATLSPIIKSSDVRYNITLDLVGITGTDNSIFNNASSRWESIVRGDLSNISTTTLRPPLSGCTYPSIIDDIYICSIFKPIDGAGRVLGSAGPIYIRRSNNLTVTGEMMFDSADINTLKSMGNLESVILHEMGHILGIGTLWDKKGIAGLPTMNCPYNGVRANAEYKSITGCDVVPTENDGRPGDGTFCGHWDEGCMKSELMTGFLNGGLNPLSRISIATLEDLGYTVDYSSAESYTSDDVLSTCRCGQRVLTETEQGNKYNDAVTSRRSLSDETYTIAMEYGLSILNQRRHQANSFTFRDGLNDIDNNVVYVGDQGVIVFVEDEGTLFDVVVRTLE